MLLFTWFHDGKLVTEFSKWWPKLFAQQAKTFSHCINGENLPTITWMIKSFWGTTKIVLGNEFYFSITRLSGQNFLVIDFKDQKIEWLKNFSYWKRKWSRSILINEIDMFEWTLMWWLMHDDMSSHFTLEIIIIKWCVNIF